MLIEIDEIKDRVQLLAELYLSDLNLVDSSILAISLLSIPCVPKSTTLVGTCFVPPR